MSKDNELYRILQYNDGKSEQVRINSSLKNDNTIQAYVLNLSACSTLDELISIYDSCSGRLDMDIALDESINPGESSWTAPRWAKIGDLVFFAHAKRANSKISATHTELKRNKHLFTEEEFFEINNLIEREKEYHKEYGGTIFAIGKICGSPYFWGEEAGIELETSHFKSRVFAEINEKVVLKSPIPVDDCSDFLNILMTGSITPVNGEVFNLLRLKIAEKNSMPDFVSNANATPLPLYNINDENWLSLSNQYRRSFMYETQYRYYYVDRLLKGISDIKTIYRECACKKEGIGLSFIDNVIVLDNNYWPVEVKLNIGVEKNIKAQVRKYCFDDYIILEKNGKIANMDKIVKDKVIIIDTDSIYIYLYESDCIFDVFDLDALHTQEDINELKKKIIQYK